MERLRGRDYRNGNETISLFIGMGFPNAPRTSEGKLEEGRVTAEGIPKEGVGEKKKKDKKKQTARKLDGNRMKEG